MELEINVYNEMGKRKSMQKVGTHYMHGIGM